MPAKAPEKSRKSFGAKLEDLFLPKLHWGVEFSANRVRLCGFKEAEGKAVAAGTFEGGYAEAAVFAEAHGLGFVGLDGAVSHSPFKIGPVESGDEDASAQAEHLRPTGLSAESLDIQNFSQGDAKLLLVARDEVVRGFCDSLPPSLSGLWSLAPSPLALLPFLDPPRHTDRWAALLPDQGHTHVLFFRGSSVDAYVKVFFGLEEAARVPGDFACELKKALVYHYASRYPGAVLEGVQVWREGSAGEMAAALATLGITQVTPAWTPTIAALPDAFRVAGALALQGLRGGEPAVSFSVASPAAPKSRRLWMRRTGMAARAGYRIVSILAALVMVAAAGAFALRWTVESKARTWSGELKKWDQFQHSKETVKRQLGGLQGMLVRRTQEFASLQVISQRISEGVWLESWETEIGENHAVTHKLEGYALAENRIPEFLSALETGRHFHSVKLKSTERIKGEVAEKKTGIAANHRDLVRFQIGVTE